MRAGIFPVTPCGAPSSRRLEIRSRPLRRDVRGSGRGRDSVRIQSRASHLRPASDDARHPVGNRQAGGQTRRLDAEQVDQSGDAMILSSLQQEIGGRAAGPSILGRTPAYAGAARRPAGRANRRGSRRRRTRPRRIDVVIDRVHPFDVRAKLACPARSSVRCTPRPPGVGIG